MRFQFNVKIDDQDYLDYNMFWLIRSPYGKKQIKTFRITMTALVAAFILISLFMSDFSKDAVLGIIPLLIFLILVQLFLVKFLSWSYKGHIKTLKKTGKMGFSPESVLEFYEDKFIEITSDNKIEQKYSVVERISIVDNKMIYIHVNNIMSYMLPLSCFEAKEQYGYFFEFIKTKCANIDTY